MHPTNGSDGAAFWPLEEIAIIRAIVEIVSARRVINFVALQLRVRSVFRLKYSENCDVNIPQPGNAGSSGFAWSCTLCVSFTSILAHGVAAHLNPMGIVHHAVEDSVSESWFANAQPAGGLPGGIVEET